MKEAHREFDDEDLDPFKEFIDIHCELGNGHLELNARRNFLGDSIFFDNFVKVSIEACGFNATQTEYQVQSHDNNK